MPVNVVLRSEAGHHLDNPPDALLEQGDLPHHHDKSYPYLRLLDPYGDTVFSAIQMAAVIPELERLAGVEPSLAMEAILQLAHRCQREVHTFLVFQGD